MLAVLGEYSDSMEASAARWQASEELSTFLGTTRKPLSKFDRRQISIQLADHASATISQKRRAAVLTKVNNVYASLGKKDFPDAAKDLFGKGFESRLKERRETARLHLATAMNLLERVVLAPVQTIEFLGLSVHSVTLCLALPRAKVRSIRKECEEELQWWAEHLMACNGRALAHPDPNMIIESDASMEGWGTHCNGVSTGGLWSKSEQFLHITCLELLAGSIAIKCFAKEKTNIQTFQSLFPSFPIY